jgi:hypothetical protein
MNDEGLITTSVPRTLELKSKLFGLELFDLLLIFCNLAVTNLIFGGTSLRYVLVWGTTLSLAISLFVLKRGRPESFLQHYGEFLAKPSYMSAAGRDLKYRKFKKDLAYENK